PAPVPPRPPARHASVGRWRTAERTGAVLLAARQVPQHRSRSVHGLGATVGRVGTTRERGRSHTVSAGAALLGCRILVDRAILPGLHAQRVVLLAKVGAGAGASSGRAA